MRKVERLLERVLLVRRISSNLCTKCDYDCRGLSRCPECGNARPTGCARGPAVIQSASLALLGIPLQIGLDLILLSRSVPSIQQQQNDALWSVVPFSALAFSSVGGVLSFCCWAALRTAWGLQPHNARQTGLVSIIVIWSWNLLTLWIMYGL